MRGPLHRCRAPCDGLIFAPQPWTLLATGTAVELMSNGRYSENRAAWASLQLG